MKKIILSSLAFALIVGMISCSKQSPTISGSNNLGVSNSGNNTPTSTNVFGEMPTDFSKKAVVEECTGAWCGYCPNGAYNIQKSCEAHPDRVYGVAIHTGDVMSDLYDNFTKNAPDDLASQYAFSGVPAGVVNRRKSTDNYNVWQSETANEINLTADCGLAIATKKVQDRTYNIEVHAGFNKVVTGDCYVVAYILEDEVHKGPAYDQHNYMDADNTSPWYQKGNPMSAANYKHNHLLRQIIFKPGLWGTSIPASYMKAGGEFAVKEDIDMSTEFDLTKVSILAMVVKKGATADQDYVLNVQECKLGSIKKWD
jgi:hypothetical protein